MKKDSGYDVRELIEARARDVWINYFNNKMTVLFLILQRRNSALGSDAAVKADLFLDDLYRYMLPGALQKKGALLFQWLRKFFKRFPDVESSERDKAAEYLQLIYRWLSLPQTHSPSTAPLFSEAGPRGGGAGAMGRQERTGWYHERTAA